MDDTALKPSPAMITPAMLNAYAQMLACLFVATLILIAIIAATMLTADHFGFSFPVLAIVALCGAMGAFVSALSRLYTLKDLPALLMQQGFHGMKNLYVLVYSLVPPVVGVISAVVLYGAVLAGLVQGDLFPKFACGTGHDQCASFVGLLHYGPVGATDYAKAMVWGFIAGFSERLVPSALEQLANSQR